MSRLFCGSCRLNVTNRCGSYVTGQNGLPPLSSSMSSAERTPQAVAHSTAWDLRFFAGFLLEFTAAAVGGHFGPLRRLDGTCGGNHSKRAWMGRVFTAFADVVLLFFRQKEPALTTYFVRQHMSPHIDLACIDVLSVTAFCLVVNVLQNLQYFVVFV